MKQLIGSLMLVVVAAVLLWAMAGQGEYFLVLAGIGFLAGLLGIKPWWVTLALGGVPFLVTAWWEVFTPGSPLGFMAAIIAFCFAAAPAGVASVIGMVAGSKRVRHAMFHGYRLLILAGFLLLPALAEAQTYYHPHGYSVAYPTIYYSDGQIMHYTVLYDYSNRAVGTWWMWYGGWYTGEDWDGWYAGWYLHGSQLQEQSPEVYHAWNPRDASLAIYFIWRALVDEPIFISDPFSPLQRWNVTYGAVTDGCSTPVAHIDGWWKDCCDNHDVGYWMGGDRNSRWIVDLALNDCMMAKLVNRMVVWAYYTGVRAGGCTHFNWTGTNCIIDCGRFCASICTHPSCSSPLP